LHLGNVSDIGIVFEKHNTLDNDIFIALSIKPIEDSSIHNDWNIVRSTYEQTGGVDTTVAHNESVMFGFNTNGQGGINDVGNPALYTSMEDNYLPNWNTRWVEWHQAYHPITTAGGLTANQQLRLSSYTIRTDNNNIDYYQSVGRAYIKVPGTDVQYWLIEPGNLAIKEATDTVGFGITAEKHVDYGGYKNITRLYGMNTDLLAFQGYPNINFEGALLSNFTIGNVTAGTLTVNEIIASVGNKSVTSETYYIKDFAESKSSFMQAQGSNNLVAWYANSLPNLSFIGFTDLNAPQAANVTFGSHFRYYQNGTNGYLLSAENSVKMDIGYSADPANYKFNHIIAQQYYTNSMAGDPTTSDIDAGYNGVWKNTTSGNTYLYINDGGTMKRLGPFVTF
jgi:hypothetical protein